MAFGKFIKRGPLFPYPGPLTVENLKIAFLWCCFNETDGLSVSNNANSYFLRKRWSAECLTGAVIEVRSMKTADARRQEILTLNSAVLEKLRVKSSEVHHQDA